MVALYNSLQTPDVTGVVVILGYRLLSFWLPTRSGFAAAACLGGGSFARKKKRLLETTPADGWNFLDTAFSLIYTCYAPDTTDPWKLFDRLGAPYANDLLVMSSGWGYWIKVNADNVWHVEY